MELIKIATRQSPLALWQAHFIADQLKQLHPELRVELVPMVTSGDKFLKDKLQAAGGKGLFVKELEEALLDKRADIAVHSMKDVPTTFPDGLGLSVISHRHKPLDALISRTKQALEDLPKGSVIGTTSLRRQSQLLALRPDLNVKPLRGNVNTRLEKLRTGEYDAIILAVAGLERLGQGSLITEIIDEEIMLPACGQGALGIECRNEDETLKDLLAPLNDPLSALCVHAERHVNALLGGNCNVPLAVYCQPQNNDHLLLRARVLSADGKTVIADQRQGSYSQAMQMADDCTHALLAKGAGTLLLNYND
ncbi:hydroxymethylbilane synthase [Legionella jordanis]|uniref:Porphobilinogen deaminase n=1 Tax=Legionella jordanis TaxID=456 RepID=A0A0W0VBT4_9GAMM|nr:hydroxymethylbilane synthase [Legionella jordanis]KTD17566.1 porphobilinogen deaminase [Legionella jordanis]RMX05098.1 hydroxymethylbilane synthase [Legionella jordanis]RMX17354.1 hydroxymethylbilane synthase [Legionella jordanis]VEH13535.1 porphobilinogen deaminase [Legionella jordanis]HAT8714451.1 hydroxymethylbilane synthase [Legionella jordanis]